MTEHFSNYVDYDFTAHLEAELDDIAADNKDWIKVLRTFWVDFDKKIKEKSELDRTKITQKSIDEDCPKCGKPLLSKLGRRGNFIACSDYPECKFTRSANGDLPQEPKVVGKDAEQILIFFFLLVLMALTFNSVPKRKIQKLNLNA